METFYIVVLVLCLIALVYAIWLAICNEITFKQRQRLLTYTRQFTTQDIVFEMFDEFHRVSYEKHMYSLMMFKNPMKLYNQELFGDMK